MMIRYIALVVVLMCICCSPTLQARDTIPAMPQGDLGIFENTGGYVDTTLLFVNESGDTVMLGSVLDKPTALLLVFYRCRGICSPLMDGAARVISATDLVLGEDYQVLNISFNPREDAALAREKKKNYVAQLTREVDESGWMFFTGDSLNIASITDSVGFKYLPNGPDDYIHAAALIMLSPDGQIIRYLMGTDFLPFDFKMSVVEANAGRPGPTINKLLQYCFNYDPEGRTYVFNMTKITGSIILLAIALFVGWLFLSRKNRSKGLPLEEEENK
jgi:protein SCO1